ncbi:MAG: substrate-binding domain-containing protein [Candidatus Thorarchaeota archaeon]
MKKLLFIVIVLVIIMSACTSPEPTKAPAPEPEVVCPDCPEAEETISIFQEAQNGVPFRWAHDNAAHPVVRIMAAGFAQACEDYDVLCEDMSVPNVDGPAKLAMTEQSIALGSSGQIFPIYLPEHYQQAQDMMDAGIPVIGTHFPVDAENVEVTAWVAPNNVQYASAAGVAMAEKVECEGPIGVTQSSLNDGENAVAENFREAFLEVCPDTEVLEIQLEGLDDPAAAILVASSIIQANPDLKGGFSTTGAGPTTWAKAAEENGKEPGEITIISMDYTRPNLDLVKSGEVYMLVGQPLFEEFYFATVLLIQNLMGYPVPVENVLPAPQITLENIDQYYRINDLAESAGQ